MKLFALALVALVALSGCTLIQNVPDATLAADLQAGTTKVVSFGLTALINKFPASAATIKGDSALADTIIKTVAVPGLSGATTGADIQNVFNAVSSQLNGKISPEVSAIVSSAIALAGPYLPAVPTDKISSRNMGAILGVLNGMSAGIEVVTAN